MLRFHMPAGCAGLMLLMTAAACSSPSGGHELDLLRSSHWKFVYLGHSLRPPAPDAKPRAIRLPGRWHESLPGTPRRGVGYFRLDFALAPEDTSGKYPVLVVGRVESAALIRLNGETIGRVGRPGVNRAREFARIHPEFLELRPGLLRETNRLELIVSNYHTRGGALLKLGLSGRRRAHDAFALRLLREALLLGMLCVAGIFFFIIWLTDRGERSYLFFSLLMFLIIMRGGASNGLLEFLAPSRDWTDPRLLLETWSGISMTPAVLFWFLHQLFPVLRERPRPWSGPRDLLRVYCVYFSGVYLTVGGLGLSCWFLIVFDASIYVAHLGIILRVFILPSLFLFLLLLIFAVAHAQEGALVVFAGFLVFMAAALADVSTIEGGSAVPLRAPAGMLIFVLCVSIVLGRRIHGLHNQVLRGRDSLREGNRELRRMGRIKDKFLLNSARIISRPLSEITETVLTLLEKPGPGMGAVQLKLLTRLAAGGKESLRRFNRMEYYLTRLQSRHAPRVPVAPAEFLGRELIALEKTRDVKLRTSLPEHMDHVLADPESLRMMLGELCELAARSPGSAEGFVSLEDSGPFARLGLELRSETAAAEPGENDILPEFSMGIPLMERIAEIHGGRLETRRETKGNLTRLRWSFQLEYADSHDNPARAERIRHARFLSEAGFPRQASRELRKYNESSRSGLFH